jgi:hypothetical protein
MPSYVGIVVILSVATISPMSGQRGTTLPGVIGATIDASVPARVPLTLLDGGRPVVQAMVNGRGPYLFGIETGGTFGVILDRRVANEIGLSPRSDDPSTALIDSITIGTFTIRKSTGALRSGTGVPGTDGLIGIAAFRNLVLTVDYPAGQVLFATDTLPATNARDILPLLRTGPLVGVGAALAGHTLALTLDTQGGTAVGCQPEIADQLRLRSPKVVVGQARVGGVGAAPVNAYAARLDGDVRFGGVTIQRPIVTFIPLPTEIACVIGVDALRHFAVAVDQRSMRVRFAAADPSVPPPPSQYTLGLGIVAQPGGIRILAVPAGSPAEAAGVRPGDELVELNGQPATLTTASPAAVRALANRGKEIRLKVRRGGELLGLRVMPRMVVQ